MRKGEVHVGYNNTISIIIDLALDHSDYYTLVESAFLADFDLIAGFAVHLALVQFGVHHDQAVECFWPRSR